MNREIKYRAWDKVKKEFIDFNKIGFLEDGSMWYLQGLDEYENEIDPPYFEDDDTWVLLQFTGLKDKNGVEIYGNDVIEKEGHPSYYVSFESGSFVVISTNSIQALNWEHWSLSEMLDLGFTYIGNIYENPDLLEATK